MRVGELIEPKMIPAGYLAKRVVPPPGWLKLPHIVDVYSLGDCVNDDFADYVDYWKHNGFWLFDTPRIIRSLSAENSFDLEGTSLFYYEIYSLQYLKGSWTAFSDTFDLKTDVERPANARLEGFDVVTFRAGNSPEHSPLSCNSLAEHLPVNEHCLLASFNEAHKALSEGQFEGGEPGPYRIFAVYSVDWPHVESDLAV